MRPFYHHLRVPGAHGLDIVDMWTFMGYLLRGARDYGVHLGGRSHPTGYPRLISLFTNSDFYCTRMRVLLMPLQPPPHPRHIPTVAANLREFQPVVRLTPTAIKILTVGFTEDESERITNYCIF